MSILIKIPLNPPLAKGDLRWRPRAALELKAHVGRALPAVIESILIMAGRARPTFPPFPGSQVQLGNQEMELSTFNLHDAQFPGLVVV